MGRKFLGGFGLLASVVAGVGVAGAADLAVKAPVYKAPVIYPTWAGFYLGAHIGGAWGDVKVDDLVEDANVFHNRSSAAFGGATIGYNFQAGNFVYGAELDFGGMGLSHSAANPIDSDIVSKIGSGFYMDATARAGFAFDRALIYAKGGYAYYGGTLSITDIPEAGGFAQVSGFNGWTLGGGLEYKLDPHWSVKGEYQFFDFGNHSLVNPVDVVDRFDNRLTIQTVKAGINYHF